MNSDLSNAAKNLSQKTKSNPCPEAYAIYVLYKHSRKHGKDKYDLLYVGMTNAGRRGGIVSRLRSHRRNKKDLWTHFSVFEVWDNIRDEEVAELEGLFRHLYRNDTKANSLNVQRGFKKAGACSRRHSQMETLAR